MVIHHLSNALQKLKFAVKCRKSARRLAVCYTEMN